MGAGAGAGGGVGAGVSAPPPQNRPLSPDEIKSAHLSSDSFDDTLQQRMQRMGVAANDPIATALQTQKYNEEHSTQATAQHTQQHLASNFRGNIGSTEGNLYNLAQQQGQAGLNQGLGLLKSRNSSRGLLYGGINQGQEGQARSAMSEALANQRSSINSNVENEANLLDQQAVQTGVGIQKNAQQVQNDIYSQAMADMNANNAEWGSALSAIGAGAAIVATGGAAAPAVAGYYAANSTGGKK